VVFEDDSQIVRLKARKAYTQEPPRRVGQVFVDVGRVELMRSEFVVLRSEFVVLRSAFVGLEALKTRREEHMTAREYLEDIRDCTAEIFTLSEAIDRMIREQAPAGASAAGCERERVQAPCRTVPASSFLPALLDRVEELKERREGLNKKRVKASREIDGIRDSKLRTLLYCRYILNYSWKRVKDRLNCSERHVYSLHRTALDEFSKIFAPS